VGNLAKKNEESGDDGRRLNPVIRGQAPHSAFFRHSVHPRHQHLATKISIPKRLFL
jgi:hypothetical protein